MDGDANLLEIPIIVCYIDRPGSQIIPVFQQDLRLAKSDYDRRND
ncbi:MAG: hypothetical protein BMS9Abin05_1437 [Rhodothermia bacterium]|nr:MAG: hypothetical protein BMS9Abin05_1437 [Rhodothermia bacterium]